MLQENKRNNKVIWLTIALISLSAIVLINQFSPYIPDYDGLGYFHVAKLMNGWLYESSGHLIWTEFANTYISFWPISNALSVFIAAVFYHTIDLNVLPTLINAIYLFLFATYLTKIRPASYVLIVILLLCSTTLFFRLFTTLTTEFSVGLWIFSFLLTLVSSHERRGIYLAALTIIGLLLRTIDVVFILMAVTAYLSIHYLLWHDRQHVLATLRSVGLSLLLTAPLMFQHYLVAYQYVYNASFGATAASWKSLGGVSDRYDVIQQYARFLSLYNPFIIPATFLITALAFYSKALHNRSIVLIIGLALAVSFPLLMASSLNIQVVFWIYASLIFMVCELGFLFYYTDAEKPRKSLLSVLVFKNVFLVCISLGCIFFLVRSWNYEVPYLRQQQDISKISFDISKVFDNEPSTPTVAANYRGVGALDITGLAWRKDGNYAYGGINDIYSKNKKPAEYLALKETTNFFITAHENYFFAPHFGINDHIKETHRLFSEKSSEMGFRQVKEISRDGRDFDIWYRPGVQAHLQYASFGDNWISWKLPLDIGNEELCNGSRVSGKLNFSASFPSPNLTTYAPPFIVTVRNKKSGEVVSTGIVNEYGIANTSLNVEKIDCGKYELSIDKSFSTKADPRELSAQFIKLESILKFELNEGTIDGNNK